MDEARLMGERHTLAFELVVGAVDLVDAEVQHARELLPLVLGQPYHQSHVARLEEEHAGRFEQEWNAERIAVEILRALQVADGHGNLPDGRQLYGRHHSWLL